MKMSYWQCFQLHWFSGGLSKGVLDFNGLLFIGLVIAFPYGLIRLHDSLLVESLGFSVGSFLILFGMPYLIYAGANNVSGNGKQDSGSEPDASGNDS